MSKKKQDRYAVLSPTIECLSDVVILSQAWKKTHTYVRNHNWYADTLELDCSAVNLERNLDRWSEELRSGSYTPLPARLVPAPKSEPWVFREGVEDGWMPEAPHGERFLRPLAHIGIREQTVASAAMLCLADCVESVQGDTSSDVVDQRMPSIFSYGNRLFCSWNRDGTVARFPWGNSNTYSRYFEDYQSFVERPLNMAQKVALEREDSSGLFVIKLDLSAFYDNTLEEIVRTTNLISTEPGLPDAFEGNLVIAFYLSTAGFVFARTGGKFGRIVTTRWPILPCRVLCRLKQGFVVPVFKDTRAPIGTPPRREQPPELKPGRALERLTA